MTNGNKEYSLIDLIQTWGNPQLLQKIQDAINQGLLVDRVGQPIEVNCNESILADGLYGDIEVSGNGTILSIVDNAVANDELNDSGVTAGSYDYVSLTVDSTGRITAISSNTISSTHVIEREYHEYGENNGVPISMETLKDGDTDSTFTNPSTGTYRIKVEVGNYLRHLIFTGNNSILSNQELTLEIDNDSNSYPVKFSSYEIWAGSPLQPINAHQNNMLVRENISGNVTSYIIPGLTFVGTSKYEIRLS